MFRQLVLVLAITACWLQASLATVELSPRDLALLKDMLRGGNGYGQKVRRQSDSPWKYEQSVKRHSFNADFHCRTILEGLLRSQHFSSIAAQIPCDIITSLESDEYQAQQFIQQVEAGQVPTIIQDLPSEIVDAFTSIVDIALKLPQALLDDAENAVSDAEHIFNDIFDGNIVQDIESLPGEIASDVTAEWGHVTSDLVEGWTALTHGVACFFTGGCASPTPGACASTSVPVSSVPAPVAASQTGYASGSAALGSAAGAASQAASTEAQASDTALQTMNASYIAPSASSPPTTEAVATSSGVGIAQWLLIGVVTVMMSCILWL